MVPEVYYDKSHLDCYHFCQQCEDHFETAGATGCNRTLFTALFLRGNISIRWVQFKRCNRGEKLTPITWTEFKAFLQKNLGESKSFVDSIQKKLKRDSQYKLEEVYNWASYLKHFQSILLEFDLVVASTDITMKPQISGLIVEGAPTKVPVEYSDFVDVFSPNLASKLSEHTGINEHAIELVKRCQQPPYGPI